ncbi:M3 family metallopeptidase [Ferrimonas pelagia]|uniref:M3 family metallopeptidase n=1 Tax=Ferrimonas pelagia TaxID=1177826 RepID=A0ABP9EJJ4_9GAMM
MSPNPLLQPFEGPFGLPPFDQISDADLAPALEQAMAQHRTEIDAIIHSDEPANFGNTIEAMERAGAQLTQIWTLFSNLVSADTNAVRQTLQQQWTPVVAAHYDAIRLEPALFARIEAVWSNKSALTGEALRLTDKRYQEFVRGGARLQGQAKQRFAEINAELSRLQVTFGQNLLEENNAFVLWVTSADELAGLPEAMIAQAAAKGAELGREGDWAFGCDRTVLYPFLTYAQYRGHRETLYKGYLNRADNDNERDNKANLRRQAALRLERANLLGYATHAHYILEDRMVGSPEDAKALMSQVWQATLGCAQMELADLQGLANSQGANFGLKGWDWWFYAAQLRQQRFELDEAQLKPYFSLDNVIEGAFYTARRLFGLDFRALDNVPLYHPQARAWEVLDPAGQHLGIFIGDYLTRDSKRGGAWMTVFRQQSGFDGPVRPIVQNVCNFPPAAAGEPVLLGFEHVKTLFHEFGHALHGLLSQCQYPGLAGTSVARDFVEFPSQVLEHWAMQPEVLAHYARHVESGQVIPQVLVDKIQQASQFNQGFQTGEFLAAALLDMAWHTLDLTEEPDVLAFEAKIADEIQLPEAIAYRYRSTAFAHIFSGGYSAGYYSYLYSAVLDCDGFNAFVEAGNIFDPNLANKLKTLLESGDTVAPDRLYQQYRGRAPQIEALLQHRGLQ